MFLLTATIVYAQQPDTKELKERVVENRELFKNDPDQAFLNTEILLKEAISAKDHHSELILLVQRCWYYNLGVDIDGLIHSAQILEKKSVEYKKNNFKANAHVYLLNAYAVNNLYEKAIAEFDKTMAILNKENEKDRDVIISKYNAYTGLANMYSNSEKESEKALPYLLSASKEIKKLKDPEERQRIQYRNYSNIAVCYLKIDPDSVAYYVQRSMELQSENTAQGDIFMNYSIYGDVHRLKENYSEALVYYHKAEKMLPEVSSSHIMTRGELFRGLQEVYEALSDTMNANHYALKVKELDLEVSQNKYKSLHKILEDTPVNDSNKKYYIISIISLILTCGITVIFIFRLKKRNRLLQEQERKSEEYLGIQESSVLNNNREQLYKDLVGMVEKDDPDFMEEFRKAFPDFSEKLCLIHPLILDVDIEFCALLKLSMPTKEIARWKNISHRTVQNRKYRLRKRLDIPDNVDIYYWFSQF